MRPGGSEGGVGKFFIGLLLTAVAVYFFFDSFRVVTGHGGLLARGIHRGGLGMTTSMGILLVPLLIGLIALFYNARQRWAWWLTWTGVAILVVEMVSRIRFVTDMKATHLILILLLFAAGIGLMLRGMREERSSATVKGKSSKPETDSPKKLKKED